MHHCLSPRPGALHHVRPDATRRRCSARLRHEILRDHRKPQKEDGLTLYEKFARISQFASPAAARCNPVRTPPALQPALGTGTPRICSAGGHFGDGSPTSMRAPEHSGGLPPHRESG
jgi:hypothetical protein